MTLNDILTLVTDAYSSASSTKATRMINECYRRAATLARVNKDSTNPFTLVAGTAEYPLPSDCYLVERVVWDNKELTKTPEDEMASVNKDWRTASNGTPTRYFVRRALGKIRFYVPPDATAITKTVVLTYQYIPADLSLSTDVPVIPAAYHDMLAAYAVWKLAEQDEEDNLANRWAAIYAAREREFASDMGRDMRRLHEIRVVR